MKNDYMVMTKAVIQVALTLRIIGIFQVKITFSNFLPISYFVQIVYAIFWHVQVFEVNKDQIKLPKYYRNKFRFVSLCYLIKKKQSYYDCNQNQNQYYQYKAGWCIQNCFDESSCKLMKLFITSIHDQILGQIIQKFWMKMGLEFEAFFHTVPAQILWQS